MKFCIQREDLLKALQTTVGVTASKSTLPVLSNVLIEAGESKLSITTTDLEIQMIHSVDLICDTPGRITAPAKKLLDIVKALPKNAGIDFSLHEDKLKISSGKSRYTLSTLDASDFPITPSIETALKFKINQDSFKDVIVKTYLAMANNDTRYFLNGLYIAVDGSTLTTVATDGHRLGLSKIDFIIATPGVVSCIIPRKGIEILLNVLNKVVDYDGLDVEMDNNHIRIGLLDISFTSKLIDGKFPDYQRVVPESTPQVATLDKIDFASAVNRAMILADKNIKGITLDFNLHKLYIKTLNVDSESAIEELDIQYSGAPIRIGFNADYLTDILKSINEDKVCFGLKDDSSSALLYGLGNSTDKYVLMPMRL